jgi:hypothetical protein
MKKIIIILLVTFSSFTSTSAFSQEVLEKKALFNNKLSLLVPKDFVEMNEKYLAENYSDPTFKPKTAMGDADGKIILALNFSETAMDDNGVPGYTDELIGGLKNRKKTNILDDGILLQGGKNIGYVKFTTSEKKQKIFHYRFYISFQERLLAFQFTCPKKMRNTWETKAEEMANSIRVGAD